MEGKDGTICTGKKMIVSNHKGLHLFSIEREVFMYYNSLRDVDKGS